MGAPSLLQVANTVADIIADETQTIIDDLIENMRHYGGVGIAAPQIGYDVRIFVFEITHSPRYPTAEPLPLTVVINPEIEYLTEETDASWEGCLSVPGYRGLVARPTHIRYSGYDREANVIKKEATGFEAKVVQHETDHINGILFPMRIDDMRNFACDDVLWQQNNNEEYPEYLKQALREHWDL
jgi:peptide deformylase